jgi:hypothetical protein
MLLGRKVVAGAALAALAVVGCGVSDSKSSGGTASCMPGQVLACMCPDGRSLTSKCLESGRGFEPCACGPSGAGGTTGSGGAVPGTGGVGTGGVGTATGTGGKLGTGGMGTGGMGTGGMAGTGGKGTGGMGTGGMGTGGVGTGGMGTGGMSGTGGTSATGDDPESLRKLCVDTINMYRATVSPAVPALKQGTTAQEDCSDKGAKTDGDSGQAHGSAGSCPGLGGQDTCPGWGVGGFTGNATVADALKNCLMQMWGEGMPPVSRQACQQDYTGCFLKYGHYLNMSDPSYHVASCGFYKMADGKWWMNQDFGF